MARISKADRLKKIHQDALAEFADIQSAGYEERKQCLQDRRFYSISGAQWEGSLSQQFENRPRLESNKVHAAVLRILSEYRGNQITVDFVSKDGSSNDKLADVCDGLYRSDEQDSGAQEAYINAFEEAVGGGFGAFRLCAEYENSEDEEDKRQRIRFEPICDADSSVWFDLGAKRQSKADATACYVVSAIPRSQYIREYKDDPASWPKSVSMAHFDWATPDVVYVAELYRVEEKSRLLVTFRSPTGEEQRIPEDELEAEEEEGEEGAPAISLLDELEASGWIEVGRKKVKHRRVHKYLMSGGKILEDCGYIAGKNIPVVPVFGKRWYVDGIERAMGHVRLAKDSQRIANMQRSRLAEISAYSTIEKPIFTPEQMAGHEAMWANDTLQNYPYLLANAITGPDGAEVAQGPIGVRQPPQIPQALAALIELTERDLKDILGDPAATEKLVSNISGKAVEMIQSSRDMNAFIYISNFSMAVKRAGEIWLGMAKELYVEPGRKMKTIGAQSEIGTVELVKRMIDPNTREEVFENDLTAADFDVAVDVGPSSSNRKQSTVRALTGMMAITDDPETKQVLQAMALLNMEGDGIADVREYFRKKLVTLGALKPTEEDAEEMAAANAAQGPDANAVYLEAAAQEAAAKAEKARADTELSLARADQTKAETAKTIVEIGSERQDQVLQVVDRMQAARPEPAEVSIVAVETPDQFQ